MTEEKSNWRKSFEALGVSAEEAAEGIRKFIADWNKKNKSANQEEK